MLTTTTRNHEEKIPVKGAFLKIKNIKDKKFKERRWWILSNKKSLKIQKQYSASLMLEWFITWEKHSFLLVSHFMLISPTHALKGQFFLRSPLSYGVESSKPRFEYQWEQISVSCFGNSHNGDKNIGNKSQLPSRARGLNQSLTHIF